MYVDEKAHGEICDAFLPAGKLGISQAIYDAFIEVRRMLLSGKIKQSRYVRRGAMLHDRMVSNSLMKDEGACFSYLLWHHPNSCGTTACIGGWVETLTGLNADYGSCPALHALYYEGRGETTPMEAAKAIENVLHGKNVWGGVYANPAGLTHT